MIDTQRPAPLWPHLLACAVLAVWIDFGRHHRYENADSIIPILVSLKKWTLFYWDQRRFGMLIPLLAMPARSPLANLLLQNALTIFGGLAAGVLLARHCVGGRSWPLVGWLGTALMLWLSPDDYRRRLFGTSQPYGSALALAVAGLLLARVGSVRERPARIAAASVAFLLAHWLSPATLVVVLSLVWLPRIGAIVRDPRRAWRDSEVRLPSALALGSAAIVTAVSRLHPYGRNHDQLLPPGEWPRGWMALAARLPEMVGPFDWLAIAGGIALAGLLIAWVRDRDAAIASPALHSGLALLGAALVYWLFTGSLKWVVIQNDASPRYLIPCFQLLQCAAAVAALLPWIARDRRLPAGLSALGAIAALAAAGLVYGLPSLSGVRSDLYDQLGRSSDAVLAADCTHLAGDYWEVWPAVFYADMKHHEAGRRDVLWGVTFRSEPTRAELRAAAARRLRLCAARGFDLQRVRRYDLGPLRLIGQRGEIDIYAPLAEPIGVSRVNPG